MKNDDGEYTFRQWNPKLTNAPWGFENDAVEETWQTSWFFWVLCPFHACFLKKVNMNGSGGVNIYKDGDISAKDLLDGEEDKFLVVNFCLRFFAFILSFMATLGVLFISLERLAKIFPFFAWLAQLDDSRDPEKKVGEWMLASLSLNISIFLGIVGVSHAYRRYYSAIPLICLSLVGLFIVLRP